METKAALADSFPQMKTFLALALATGDLVFVVDEKRRMVFANRAACGKTGYKEKDLRSKKFSVLYRKELDQRYTALLQGGHHARRTWRGEMELRSTDGTVFRVEAAIAPFDAGQAGPPWSLVVCRDLRPERTISQWSWERSEELLSIFNSMADGVCVCDPKGTILMCNAAFSVQLGYRNDEIVGSGLPYAWTDAANAAKLKSAFRIFGKDRLLRNHHFALRRRDGTTMIASLSFARLGTGGAAVPTVVVTMRDVTDVQYAQDVRRATDQLYRLQLDVQRKAQRLQTLQDINAFVLNNADVDRIFMAITTGIKNLVGHDLAGIYLYDPERESFFAHTLSKQTAFSRKLAKFPLQLGEGIIGAAAVSGKLVWVNNAQLDPRSRYPRGMRPEKEHFIAVPLRGRRSIFGILVVARHRAPEFIEEEALIVKSFADAATVALENAQLHFELGGSRAGSRTPPSRHIPGAGRAQPGGAKDAARGSEADAAQRISPTTRET